MTDSIDLTHGQVFGFLRRGLFPALVLSLVLAAALYRWGSQAEPAFRAQVALVTQSPQVDLRTLGLPDVNFSPLHVDAYSVAVASGPVLSTALSSVGLPATQGAVNALRGGALQVQALPVPQLLYISVTESSPDRAADLANAIAEQLQAWDRDRLKNELQRMAQLLSQRIAVQQLLLQELEAEAASAAQVAATQQTLTGLRNQLDSIVALSTNATSTLKVLRAATPPTGGIGRSPVMFALLGLILGAMLAYGFVFVLELFNGRLYTAEGVERATGLPVLAEIARPKRGASVGPDVAVTLQANLRNTMNLALQTTILVTGVSEGDDTATAAVALAESFARRGMSTLLVDADIRKPAIAHRYRVPPTNPLPLTTCTLGHQGARKPMRIHISERVRLALIYEGESSPEEIVTMLNGLPACLGRWKAEYHAIVIRAAPLSTASDSLIISESCDGVILAIDPRTSNRRRLLATVTRLRHLGVQLVAAVATGKRGKPAMRQEYRLEYPTEVIAAAPRTRAEPPRSV